MSGHFLLSGVFFVSDVCTEDVTNVTLLLASVQCRLHIHASFSTTMKMNVPMLPLSQPNALGLILAHGKKKDEK